MKKPIGALLCLLMVLSLSGAAMANKQEVVVRLFYSSQWNDVTSRVRTGDAIVINHGSANEQTGVVPSDAELTFDNRDGEMNPDNRLSSLFGLIGHNTPLQIQVGDDIRFTGQIVSWKPRRAIKGNERVEVRAQGTIRRLGQGTPPVESALYRTMIRTASGVAPTEYWPLEDGATSTQFASAASVGGAPSVGLVTINGTEAPRPDGHSGITGSSASVLLPLSSLIRMDVRPYTGGGQWVIQGALFMDDLRATGSINAFLESGSQFVISVTDDFNPGVLQSLVVEISNSAGSAIFLDETPLSANLTGEPFSVMFALVDTGGGTDAFTARVIDSDGETRAEITTTNVGYRNVRAIEVEAGGGVTNEPLLAASHVGLYTSASFDKDVDTVTIARAAGGFAGETAGDRFERLCGIEGISATIVGTAADTQLMGPQYPDTLLGLLDEIAETDAGVIYDTREELGLTFRTGRSLYNQAA